jgi:hypothetical protein
MSYVASPQHQLTFLFKLGFNFFHVDLVAPRILLYLDWIHRLPAGKGILLLMFLLCPPLLTRSAGLCSLGIFESLPPASLEAVALLDLADGVRGDGEYLRLSLGLWFCVVAPHALWKQMPKSTSSIN